MASYQDLLKQLVSNDLPALQSAWSSVQQILASDPGNDPCQGNGGPASLAAPLQQISDQACSIAHNAAAAALGYTLNCYGAGADNYANAQRSTNQACTLKYYWAGAEWGPYGTSFITGSAQATCLDPSFLSAVGAQVSAAIYAVAQAQAAMQACVAAGSVSKSASGANLSPHAPRSPILVRPVIFTAFNPVIRSAT